MKRIIMLIVFLSAFGTLLAQTNHNPLEDESAQMSVKVITPFLIWDVTPDSNPFIEDVIKGQKRIFDTFVPAQLFQMQKEADYTVRLQLRVPQPVDGVSVTAHWFFNDTPPDWQGGFPGTALDSDWDWFGSQTDGWITIRVTEIDAINAGTKGLKTFTANATGWYLNL